MDFPLNKAHQQGRKADQCLKQGKFKEAILLHEKAAEYLREALNTTPVSQAQQSIKLQEEFHKKQKVVIQYKEKQNTKLLQHLNKIQNMQKKVNSTSTAGSTNSAECLNITEMDKSAEYEDVFKTIAATDSLLQHLYQRQTSGCSPRFPTNTSHHVSNNTLPTEGTNSKVLQKTDKSVIEELRTRNVELSRWVNNLLIELEDVRGENADLRSRIGMLEEQIYKSEKEKATSGSSSSGKVPLLDLDNLDALELPPLETPVFDFVELENELLSLEPTVSGDQDDSNTSTGS